VRPRWASNFYRPGPRYADPAALLWLADLPSDIWKVGVFVNEDPPASAASSRNSSSISSNFTATNCLAADCPRDLRVWKAIRVDYCIRCFAFEKISR